MITKVLAILSAIAGAITALIIINKALAKHALKIRDWLNEPTKKDLESLRKEFKDKDIRDCQTDLLHFLRDVESGHYKSEIQIEHMCRIYEHYTKNLGGNHYVASEWKRVFPTCINRLERRKEDGS